MKIITILALLLSVGSHVYAGGNAANAFVNGFASGFAASQGRTYTPPDEPKRYDVLTPEGKLHQYRVDENNPSRMTVTDERGRMWIVNEK